MEAIEDNMPRVDFINYITVLMEHDEIEKALLLIKKHFKHFTILEKKLVTINILEATKQYVLKSNDLPEEYFDFLASCDSNELFF